MNTSGKVSFVLSFVARFLRRNPGDEHSAWLRQVIIGGLAVKDFRFANNIKVAIRADGGKLCGSVQRRVSPEGFVVMEQEGRVLLAVIHCSVLSVTVRLRGSAQQGIKSWRCYQLLSRYWER